MRTRTDGGRIGNDTKDESGFSLAVWHLGKSASLLSLWKNQAFHCLDKERRIGTRSGRAGPSFSVRPEKGAKGAVSHGTSAAERSRHVKKSSANLPKLDDSHRLKHMGRFVFALRAKIPSSHAEELLRVLPRPPGSAQRRRMMPVTKAIRNHAFLCTFFCSETL